MERELTPLERSEHNKKARIVRTLIDSERCYFRDLQATALSPDFIKATLQQLIDQGLVLENLRGNKYFVAVSWERLLRQWARESPFEPYLKKRVGELGGFFASDLDEVLVKLRKATQEEIVPWYAITGSLVAGNIVPQVNPIERMLTIYTQNSEVLSDQLRLVMPVHFSDCNIWLVQNPDLSVYFGAIKHRSDLRFVSPSQAAIDLLSLPGRSRPGGTEEEADRLIEWMKEHEPLWRRKK